MYRAPVTNDEAHRLAPEKGVSRPLYAIHLEQGDGRWRITDLDWYQGLGE